MFYPRKMDFRDMLLCYSVGYMKRPMTSLIIVTWNTAFKDIPWTVRLISFIRCLGAIRFFNG